MIELIQNLLLPQRYIPHGHCYLWQSPLVGLHVASDAMIAFAYYAIPIILLYFTRKRQDLPFKNVFLLFGAFIVFCGTTHLAEIWTLWYPTYWVSGALKLLTAFVSIYTVRSLIPLIPQALTLRSPRELETINQQLEKQILETNLAKANLQSLAIELEIQVQEKTKAIADLQATQSKLIQSAKMSSLGQLVAGVAHEINNPVSFIGGNILHTELYTMNLTNLIKLYQVEFPQVTPVLAAEIEKIDLDFILEDLPNLVSSMKLGVKRIAGIVCSLRNFSRMDEAELKQVDIHEGIDSSLVILQSRLKAKPHQSEIEIIKNYGNLPSVSCYPGQLNQVFMNILVNAIDALEVSIEHPQVTIQTGLTENQEAKISIIDNGLGMTMATKQKLFDPFFTTKAIGKGTGLGLSISYQIITEHHRGSLWVNSILGEGTEFIIVIPLNQDRAILSL